jgi:hypothetical protein
MNEIVAAYPDTAIRSSLTISIPINRKTTAGSNVIPRCISTSRQPVLPGSIKRRSGSQSCRATRSRTRHSPPSNNLGGLRYLHRGLQ